MSGAALGRYYSPRRRAYTPRMWPVVVTLVPLMFVIELLIFSAVGHPLGPFVGVVAGFVIGATVAKAQWAIWSRRHPPIPLEQLARERLDDMRRKAPFN